MSTSGISIVQTADRIVFRAYIVDTNGARIVSSTTNLTLYELQDDGTLFSFDWTGNTFKSGTLSTENKAMVHQKGDNDTTDTGIWTYVLSNIADFVKGNVYFAVATHASGVPVSLTKEFQFGDAEGDLTVDSSGNLIVDIVALSTGFGDASPNNLKSHLNAMMSTAATAPASGVGTYSPTTDSLEALGTGQTDIKGSGFSTGSDSLAVIKAYLVDIVTPNIVSSTALSGSGFLSDCVSWIRKATDEPSTEPKYTDTDIVELIHNAFDTEMADINIVSDHPIKVRLNISIVDGQQYYVLPPNCASIWQIAKILSSTNTPQWEVYPGSDWDFSGQGFQLEGNSIRLLRDWNTSETLQVTYIPNGETSIHKATAASNTANTVTFPSSATDGSIDTRANAYAGYMLRILSSSSPNRVEERIITAYDNTTKIATLSEDFDETPSGTVVYEVLPLYSRLLRSVVQLRAALDILQMEGLSQKEAVQAKAYMVRKSALRRFLATKQGRFPHHMEGNSADNSGLLGGFY